MIDSALALEIGNRGLGSGDHRAHVEIEHRVDQGVVDLAEGRASNQRTGVVDEHVETAELFGRRFDDGLGDAALGQIALDENRFAADAAIESASAFACASLRL